MGQRVVWQADIEAADAVGVDPALTVDVRQGEAIRFVVHRRGTIGFDTTHWDPLVTYENGEAFQASSAFSTQHQGAGGWSYEMETDTNRPSQAAWSVVHGFRPQLLLYEQAVQPTQPVAVPADDSLPVWVIASGSDDNGFVLCTSAIEHCSLQCSVSDDGVLRTQLGLDLATASADAGAWSIPGPARVHSDTVPGVLAPRHCSAAATAGARLATAGVGGRAQCPGRCSSPRRNHRVTRRWAGNLTCAPWFKATGRSRMES